MSAPNSSTPILALPTAAEIAQLDPATLAAMPAVAYDLKRLKVYSSCLRCRAKKVKCDRKEPCSRCEKHNVECSYRELASVQLDIRQFQRHLNNPKVRKDGAGIITSTATPIIVSSTASSAASSTISSSAAAEKSLLVTVASERNNVTSSPLSSAKSSPSSPSSSPMAHQQSVHHSEFDADIPSTPRRANNSKAANPAMARAKVNKLQRKKKSTLSASSSSDNLVSPAVSEGSRGYFASHRSDETTSASTSSPNSDTEMDSTEANMHNNNDDDVPIWRARPMGRHRQTPQEQDLAETFGLAAYLKAKEESAAAAGRDQSPAQNIAYEIELERALALRMPSSFARSADRAKPYSRPAASRPSHCQYPPGHHTPASWAAASEKTSLYHASFPATPISEAAPQATQCCCQIAARNGQAPGTCYYANARSSSDYYGNKHDYDHRYGGVEQATSSSVAEQPLAYEEDGHTARIQYSPSYSPSYQQHQQNSSVAASIAEDEDRRQQQAYDSRVANYGHPVKQEAPATPTTSFSSPVRDTNRFYLPELPSTLPATAPATSDLSAFQVGRDKSIKIACKYNEPNVDAWDMIEQPLPLPRPSVSQQQSGRSIKMEMGWILS
ncbi:hypothetical protein BGW42_002587 [Actinomortierella wolfii]|nr:hypothetical protein BGW42_002587 [Actinomortierella wolfii]